MALPPDMLLAFAAGLLLGALVAGGLALVAGARRARGADAERHALELERATLEAKLHSQAQIEQERATALAHAGERLIASFGQVADRTLQSHSDAFLRLAAEHLGQHRVRAEAALGEREQAIAALVKPIGDALRQTTAQLAGIEKERHEVYGALRSELQSVHLAHAALQGETRQLVKALRRPEVRGQWGEITLRRLTELAGMVENCDFYRAGASAGEDGSARPDMIVRLPGPPRARRRREDAARRLSRSRRRRGRRGAPRRAAAPRTHRTRRTCASWPRGATGSTSRRARSSSSSSSRATSS